MLEKLRISAMLSNLKKKVCYEIVLFSEQKCMNFYYTNRYVSQFRYCCQINAFPIHQVFTRLVTYLVIPKTPFLFLPQSMNEVHNFVAHVILISNQSFPGKEWYVDIPGYSTEPFKCRIIQSGGNGNV